MKLGTQLGQKARAVLECLRKNGKLNRLDLEMKLNIGPLSKTINGMYAMHYIKQFGGANWHLRNHQDGPGCLG